MILILNVLTSYFNLLWSVCVLDFSPPNLILITILNTPKCASPSIS